MLVLAARRVITAGPGEPPAEAVAIVGDRIVAVGGRDEVAGAAPGAERIDLGDRTLLPGFIDAHNHFLATGESLGSVDVRFPKVRDAEGLAAAIRDAVGTSSPGTRIRAFGFDHAKYPREPTRWDLDAVAPEHPVVVLHVSGHHLLANSAALAARGVDDDTPDPKGGRLVRDERGRITGLCLDAACGLVQPVAVEIGSHGPNFHTEAPLDQLMDDLDRAGRAYLAAGLTTVCDAQVTRRELGAYREARRRDRLRVRTACMPLSHQLEAFEALGLAGPLGDEWLWLAAMKLYADGSLIGGTAAFSEPYGERGEFDGVLYWEPDELRDLVVRAHRLGWRVGIHAQGDRAIGAVLDAFEAALAERADPDPRFRIEHAGFPTPEQIGRIARLGAITVNQPRYLYDSGDEFLRRLGDRAHRLQPLRDELDAGVRAVLSSDSDVASYRPLDTIASAVDRRTLDGEPIGLAQALGLEEAVRAHTIDAAFALGREDRLGSIEPGKLADLVVLDGDPAAIAPAELGDLPIWMTVLGGNVVHAAG